METVRGSVEEMWRSVEEVGRSLEDVGGLEECGGARGGWMRSVDEV